MTCTEEHCGQQSFPRLDPAIIVLVSDGERALLGRQASWPPGRYSPIAAFVEPREGLEAAAASETTEGRRPHLLTFAVRLTSAFCLFRLLPCPMRAITIPTPTTGRVLVEPAASSTPARVLVGCHGYAQNAGIMLEEMTRTILDCNVISMHSDISTKTNERVVVLTVDTNLDERFR